MPAFEARAIDTANAVQIGSFARGPPSELIVALNILDAVSLSRAILLVPTTVPVRFGRGQKPDIPPHAGNSIVRAGAKYHERWSPPDLSASSAYYRNMYVRLAHYPTSGKFRHTRQRKTLTASTRRVACCFRLSDAAALCSTRAAFCSVMWSSSPTA